FLNHVNLRNPQNRHFHRNKKPHFRVPKKKPTCRGVASGEAGNKLEDAPVPGLPAISVADQRQKNAAASDN
ncbi:MAG: hypothetical protein OEW48_13305, partial [Phycisphaerae bacterium]|nr:hypothetical protein [Phycisphaerae bacterium]